MRRQIGKRITAALLAVLLAAGLAGCKAAEPAAQVGEAATGQTAETTAELTAEPTAEPTPQATEQAERTGPATVQNADSRYDGMTAGEITAALTLEQKAFQMVCPAIYSMDANLMRANCYGAVLSAASGMDTTRSGWNSLIDSLQSAALESDAAIPFYYGTDAVHGVGYCRGSVIFPHNIGVGAANDAELAYQMGLAVGDEMKLTGMIWNYAPCVAVDSDPRWGRTYESYSSDYERVDEMASSFAQGLLDAGITVCAKHFFGDGNTRLGTGENGMRIDRGDAQLDETQIAELLSVYQSLVDLGVQTIMPSHSSLNGVKMHENAEYLTGVLKEQMGFGGFIVSDWESIHNISAKTLKEQVIVSVNAGIDMLMEPEKADECAGYIVEAVNEGSIAQTRVDDAVSRILNVKIEAGLFDAPMLSELETKQSDVGSDEYRALDRTGVYCGGWTEEWNGVEWIDGGSTILNGFDEASDAHSLRIITDASEANQADVAVLCIGEKPYAEWNGDTIDLSVTGELGLDGNLEAINEAKALGIPTVVCIVAGRNVLVGDHIGDWDAVVMCYLPGSEAKAIANVLVGDAPFSGTLPMPWYASTDQIGTDESMFPLGYGLTY
jgi:beta-glucosidase